MEQKVYLDFWAPHTILSGLSRIYNVPETDIMELIAEYDDQDVWLSKFLEVSQIHPDTHPLDNIMIKCKLFGKYPNKTQLEQYGLIPVTHILANTDSFLSRFLLENEISIDIENRVFTYNGYAIQIETDDVLGSKLYQDSGEVEAFYCGDQDSMERYSTVKRYPEILLTIEQYIDEHFDEHPSLGFEWSNLVRGFDQISFYVDLSDTSYIGNCNEEWQSAVPYEDYYEVEYFDSCSYPKLLFRNLWLLRYGFPILNGDLPESYVGIKAEVDLPYSMLQIDHFGDDEEE